jgi:alkanesulfonate monooxygenase SsuD/methylene tetrahydromethanopterin reductase-like flavin-dependent oxidoreductase (luciferase family)
MVRFELGVALPSHGSHASREAVLRVGGAAEELGFDSVWTTEHLFSWARPALTRSGSASATYGHAQPSRGRPGRGRAASVEAA